MLGQILHDPSPRRTGVSAFPEDHSSRFEAWKFISRRKHDYQDGRFWISY